MWGPTAQTAAVGGPCFQVENQRRAKFPVALRAGRHRWQGLQRVQNNPKHRGQAGCITRITTKVSSSAAAVCRCARGRVHTAFARAVCLQYGHNPFPPKEYVSLFRLRCRPLPPPNDICTIDSGRFQTKTAPAKRVKVTETAAAG